ncbi:hypothetical protein B0O99DRAFT_639859, partial [Bisporella sp. PMI_857]
MLSGFSPSLPYFGPLLTINLLALISKRKRGSSVCQFGIGVCVCVCVCGGGGGAV